METLNSQKSKEQELKQQSQSLEHSTEKQHSTEITLDDRLADLKSQPANLTNNELNGAYFFLMEAVKLLQRSLIDFTKQYQKLQNEHSDGNKKN